MRRTFEGFLKAYCAELAGRQTVSLRTLCAYADGPAPRVAEPLFLLALEEGKLDLLLSRCAGTWMEHDYRALAPTARQFAGDARAFLEAGGTPQRYAKVLDAFRARTGAKEADRRVTALMREKTNAALEARGITRYQLCKDLGLNMGNVYAYLGNGDATKVSRDTARRIMEYATARHAIS